VERTIAGRQLSIESGKLAKQADGSALVKYGDSVVLATAVAEEKDEVLPFLPLTIEYREKQYAAGQFPGGVIKREGKPTTKETLTMRLIDRPMRALFPKGYRDEIQVVATVLSADEENDPDLLALIGASAALTISDIPFDGPVGGCRVGLVENEFVMNPTHEQREEGELDLVVATSDESVIMMEGEADELPEEDLHAGIKCGRDAASEVEDLINELNDQCGKPTRSYSTFGMTEVPAELKNNYYDRLAQAHKTADKKERDRAMDQIEDEAIEEFCSPESDDGLDEGEIKDAFELMEDQIAREQILREGTRYDGRKPDDLRNIDCEVQTLPRTHGSAVFTRGETQAMVITTLGTSRDEQRVLDPLVEEPDKKFMVHYNFPPFCVGETRPIRGPGRREIGHGMLAESALQPVLPDEEEFPYTIRLVSDILESNGSSSMATVCGGTLSMMDAGIPITRPVAGVAMGLMQGENQNVILTDIAGVEDHSGDMDLKVAGTQNGVTAVQLDMKVQGLGDDILLEGLKKSREARLQILRKMLQTIEKPREELSSHAPVLEVMTIPQDKIGKLIGPGGSTINELQEDYDCTIEVDDDGTVHLSGEDTEKMEEVTEYIRGLTEGLQVGNIYQGTVTEVRDFGAIVELLPGRDGLCHISELDDSYVDDVEDICDVGDTIPVKVLKDDRDGTKLSRQKALEEMNKES
jgi:polyribonucleotide nucleotidyltransferase